MRVETKHTHKFVALVAAVASGESINSAAARLKIAARTAFRWSSSDRFRDDVKDLQCRAIADATGRLTAESLRAVEALAELRDNGTSEATRLAAAKAILDRAVTFVEVTDLAVRVKELEKTAAETNKKTEENPWQASDSA